MPTFRNLTEDLMAADDTIVALQTKLTSFQARSPEQGGDGEEEKTEWLRTWLLAHGIADLELIRAPDTRVTSGSRPNLIAKIPGETQETVWIFAHTDVVDAGDRSAWTHDPWTVHREGDWLFGRGVEDNQQALVSTLILADALQRLGIVPRRTLGMVFMADEESGSAHGLGYVLEKRPELFSAKDIYLVPDFGSPDASVIEIAEKGACWYRIECTGKQCHASTPEKGVNAFVASSALALAVSEELPKLFSKSDPLFSPPVSTFVPSMPLTVTQGINIVPGKAIFHLDCRILPEIDETEVKKALENIAGDIARRYSVAVDIQTVQMQKASRAALNGPGEKVLKEAISAVYGNSPRLRGLGGGTVAAHLRHKGIAALVWSCITNTCHEPNERSSITATKKDSCVFAHMLDSTQ
ncbi:MAG: M20 family metallo-hydrolase [Desulfovibrionaceae bacterium]|nr:M20 family metallo-hydrolase [Desulfovibrionaceae bacterium]